MISHSRSHFHSRYRFLFPILLLIGVGSTSHSLSAQIIGNYSGNCVKGAVKPVTSGQNSSTNVQGSFPSCRVSVYITGSSPLTLATIYSDTAGTPKANPFNANNDGSFSFFISAFQFDVNMSGAGIGSITLGSQAVAQPGPMVISDTQYFLSGMTLAQACIAASTRGLLLEINNHWLNTPTQSCLADIQVFPNGLIQAGASQAVTISGNVGCLPDQYCFDSITNSSAAFLMPKVENFSPYWFGAVGDGTTDDTKSLYTVLTAACTQNNPKRVSFTHGTFVIAPVNRSIPILPSCSNLTLTGPGVIKVKDSAGSYYSLWGQSGSPISNFHLSYLTINLNSSNNPVPSSGNLDTYPRIVLHTGNGGSNDTVDHVHVTDVRSKWVFFMASTNCSVTNNLIDNIGGGSIQHDASLIYTEHGSSGAVISGNTIVASARNANMAITAIETHSQVVVDGNNIIDMLNGMNITGADTVTVKGISVTGNSVSGAFQCISLWSLNTVGATGYGVDGADISGNVCSLNPHSYVADGGDTTGIILNPQPTLPYANVSITGNTVIFELSNDATDPYNTASIGIGFWDAGGLGGCDNCNFSNNTVNNAPSNAFRYSATGSNISFNGVTANNPGSHPNTGLNAAFRAGLFLSGASIIGGTITANGATFSDTLVTSRMGYGVELATVNVTGIVLDGVTVSCSDAVCASLVKAISPNTITQLPLVRATVNVPAALALPVFTLRLTSSIYSMQESKLYTWNGTAYYSFIEHPGTPTAGADCGVGAAVIGTDRGGRVTLGAGATVACTITFAKPFSATYYGSVQLITNVGAPTYTSRSPVGTVNGFVVGGTNLGSNIFEWAFPNAN